MTAPPDNDSTSTLPHSLETTFKVLADAERRTILQYFTDQNRDVVEFIELLNHVHEEVDEVATPRQARISLLHIHLPKLADHGVIEYDQQSLTIRYRGGTNIEALLAVATHLETSTSQHYPQYETENPERRYSTPERIDEKKDDRIDDRGK